MGHGDGCGTLRQKYGGRARVKLGQSKHPKLPRIGEDLRGTRDSPSMAKQREEFTTDGTDASQTASEKQGTPGQQQSCLLSHSDFGADSLPSW